jgi:dienelactone hydrolase
MGNSAGGNPATSLSLLVSFTVAEHDYKRATHGFSHFREGLKQYQKEDVEDCWAQIAQFLRDRFSTT